MTKDEYASQLLSQQWAILKQEKKQPTIRECWNREYRILQERMKQNPLSMNPAYLNPDAANPIIEKIIRLTFAKTKLPILECAKHNYQPELRQDIADKINDTRQIYDSSLKIYSTNKDLFDLFWGLQIDHEQFIQLKINQHEVAYHWAYKSNIKPDFGFSNGYNLYCNKTEILSI